MFRLFRPSLFWIALWAPAPALGQAVRDSLDKMEAVLEQLAHSGNFEQAQVEAEALRALLKRHKASISPHALQTISQVYRSSQDERSAQQLLLDAELDARRDPNPESKVSLLKVLAQECRRWGLSEQAFNAQQLLAVAQDSLASYQRRAATRAVQSRYDSLAALRERELTEQNRYFHIEKDIAYLYGSLLGLLLFALFIWASRSSTRWRKYLKKKELEWDILRANLEHEAQETALAAAAEATKVKAASDPPEPYTVYHGPKPSQVCLLIEPNRQVVLYLKSLLSDRFQIETAFTPAEALQMASEMLPDLIVCDAVLNGKSGIEVARQIKLNEKTNHVLVVLLTNKFGNDGKLDALRAGADAWFTRPVIDDELDASVQRLLDARKLRHEQFNRFMQLYFSENRVPIQDPFLMRTVQMIEQNLSDPDFLPDHIARKLQLSKAHFTKKLNVLTGKEPVQLIREMRLEKAKVLLEKRAGTPQAISELVGFSSSGTFALAFKEYFGENTLLLYSLPPSR